jgi:hypothetical protein
MIKLKDILFENKVPDVFVPRRLDDRIERLIKNYIKNGSKGNLDLSDKQLNTLPEILKDVSVGGHFYCYNNNLESLAGAPSSVNGNFICNDNDLKSLAGAPSSVNGSFYCNDNNLKSLIGAPSSVKGSFVCYNNNLKSLVGAPSSVGGDFYCSDNDVKFTVAQVRAVCDVKGQIFV